MLKSRRASLPRLHLSATDRNFDRWRILNVQSPFTQSTYITIATTAYPEQIVALKKFLRQRAAWMDQQLAHGQ